jgi:TonB family protein
MDVGELSASLFGGALLKDTLSRLELNTLELKLHLDNIDHRMERIEPHLDDLTARMNGAGKVKASPTNGRPKGIRAALPEIMGTQSADHHDATEIEPAPTEVEMQASAEAFAEADEVEGAGPAEVEEGALQGEREARRRRWMMTAAAILLLLAGVVGVLILRSHSWLGRGMTTQAFAKTSVASNTVPLRGGSGPPGRGGGTVQGPGMTRGAVKEDTSKPGQQKDKGGQAARPEVGTGPEETGPSHSGENQQDLNKPQVMPSAAPKIHLAKAEPAPQFVPQKPSQMSGAGLPGAVMAVRTPTKVGVQPPPVTTATNVPPPLPGRNAMPQPEKRIMVISSAELTHYVIVSRPPAYPPAAKLRQLQGDVMVRAVIGENGVVESVEAVSGPEQLRASAADAMRTWKYKPYMVNGQPQKIQTYVNFRFTMNGPVR